MQCTAGLPFLLEEGMEVAFVPPVIDAPRRATVVSVRMTGDTRAVVEFDAVSSMSEADALVGCHCLVRRSDIPEDAFAASVYLEGFSVYDASKGLVGTVAGIIDNPSQSLLVVEADGGEEVLVPLVDEFIAGIDEEGRRIDIDVPSGLFDL